MTETIKTTFTLGRRLITLRALQAFDESGEHPQDYLQRHASQDWGNISNQDAEENDLALLEGRRLLSVYQLEDGAKIWIVTEANRSATTIMFAHEY